MNKTQSTIICIAFLSSAIYPGCRQKITEIMTVTGATPLALQESVPSEFSLTITGNVKKEYKLSSHVLNKFATARIRTREVTPGGEYEGAYAYTGIPVYNIMEGVTPLKPKNAAFDRPLDLVATFHSRSGKTSSFSYGELTMADDRHPVTLAFHRRQVLPGKDPDKYVKNKHKDNIRGLRLICPREPDTARYLDDVEKLTLEIIYSPDSRLPAMKKNQECVSRGITCVSGPASKPASFDGVSRQVASGWVRVGHGRGYKGISSAKGYGLRSFLKNNFPDFSANDFFLLIGCDGYRAIFSAREIFQTADGGSFMICDTIDGKKPVGNYMLAPVDDYFVDRDVWGLSHVVLVSVKNR